jgi:hypothetical protein
VVNKENEVSGARGHQVTHRQLGRAVSVENRLNRAANLCNLAEETSYLVKKAKIAIQLGWSDLKEEFLKLDQVGISRVPSDRVVVSWTDDFVWVSLGYGYEPNPKPKNRPKNNPNPKTPNFLGFKNINGLGFFEFLGLVWVKTIFYLFIIFGYCFLQYLVYLLL